jgi:hypothetical protein
MANFTGGVTSLLDRNRRAGIDFLSAARGQQMANDVAWLNRQREVADLQLQDWEEQRMRTRAAQNYLAPIANNMQRALTANENVSDFLINQRNQMLADPTYQSFDANTQALINRSLGNTVNNQLNQLIRTGNLSEAEKLGAAFGISAVNPVTTAIQSGNPEAIAAAINAQNPYADIWMGDDYVRYGLGPELPVQTWAQQIALTGGGQGGANVYAYEFNRARALQDQIARDQRAFDFYNRLNAMSQANQPNIRLGADGKPLVTNMYGRGATTTTGATGTQPAAGATGTTTTTGATGTQPAAGATGTTTTTDASDPITALINRREALNDMYKRLIEAGDLQSALGDRRAAVELRARAMRLQDEFYKLDDLIQQARDQRERDAMQNRLDAIMKGLQ